MKKLYIVFFFFMIWAMIFPTYAQKIEQFAPYADKVNKIIVIPYVINDEGEKIKEYTVTLYYTQDEGKTFVGPLKAVSGDVGSELIKGQKQIVWAFKEEEPNFDGQNVQFKIEAEFVPLVLGGPANFAYSMLYPGWGNKKVRYQQKFRWRWVATGITTFTLLGGGLYLKSESDRNYENYLNSRNLTDAQASFDKANQQNLYANLAIITAATIWAVDIIRVILRGSKNKKKIIRIEEKNKTTLQVNVNNHYNFQTQTTVFGIRLTF